MKVSSELGLINRIQKWRPGTARPWPWPPSIGVRILPERGNSIRSYPLSWKRAVPRSRSFLGTSHARGASKPGVRRRCEHCLKLWMVALSFVMSTSILWTEIWERYRGKSMSCVAPRVTVTRKRDLEKRGEGVEPLQVWGGIASTFYKFPFREIHLFLPQLFDDTVSCVVRRRPGCSESPI